MNRSVSTFSALGDETRLALVERLSREGPQNLSRLSDRTDMTRQAVSKHLRVLEQAGLVEHHPSGRERIWALRRDGLVEAESYLASVSAQWDRVLDRLRLHVESDPFS